MAAVGGMLAASRLLAVNQSSGGSDLLLNAIAAAVIGGTSLFGGRGIGVVGAPRRPGDRVDLERHGPAQRSTRRVKFMVTGAVLLLAVTLDATARRGRKSSGRA